MTTCPSTVQVTLHVFSLIVLSWISRILSPNSVLERKWASEVVELDLSLCRYVTLYELLLSLKRFVLRIHMYLFWPHMYINIKLAKLGRHSVSVYINPFLLNWLGTNWRWVFILKFGATYSFLNLFSKCLILLTVIKVFWWN